MTDNVKINITISKELDQKFRKAIADNLGFKRGNLQIAIEEALEEWIQKKEARNEVKGNE